MNIKLIVMDMDGTLLNEDGIITQETLEALWAVQANGILLAIASGRHPKGLIAFVKQLRMDKYGGYLIGVNGAMVVKVPEMVTLKRHLMPASDVQDLFRFGHEMAIETLAVHDETIYNYIPSSLIESKMMYRLLNNINPAIKDTAGVWSFIQDHRKNYPVIHKIENYLDEYGSANKVCFAHEPEVMEVFYPLLQKRFSSHFNVMRTSPRWYELSPKGIDKGSALNEVKLILNIKTEEIMCFGDGENDLPMFAECGYPIAMANAMPLVKEKAWALTSKNTEDGIAQAIKQYDLISSSKT
ncbi:MAG: HAD-superfamily hydrolase subfamily IIB [Erysipelotrichaceae bacterium]|nr:MAG: HAD-superfamily hydrolase subfamily [Erysipelotrichaceae bacterium]TXT17146.1 MAG: HAD-superfamily hydrolase subfamily IIB [Erysipelotrichaceae bacterium]